MKKDKIYEDSLRIIFSIIALIFLLLNINSFYRGMISKPITTDDCLWTELYRIDPVSNDSNFYAMLINNILPGGVAEKAGLIDNDILLKINGIGFVRNIDPTNLLNSHKNEFIVYTISRNGIVLDIPIYVYKFTNVLFLIFWTMGFGFLLVGFFVGYSKPKELTSKLFFVLGCFISAALVLFSNTQLFDFDLTDGIQKNEQFEFLIFLVHYASIFIFPIIFLHFFLTYPIRIDFKKRKLIIILVYLIPVVYFLININLNIFVYRQNFLYLGIFQAILIPVIYITISMIYLGKSYKKITDTGLRKSIFIIRKGFLIAGIGVLYFTALKIFNTKPIFLVHHILLLPVILMLAIPISFGFSIVKYRILDTEYIIKKGLVFGFVTIIIILIYLSLVFFVDSFLNEYLQRNRQIITISFIILVTFTFDYVNKKSKEYIEKIFYREKYNYRKSLLSFSQELIYLNDINELLNKVSLAVRNSMGIKNVKLLLFDESYLRPNSGVTDIECECNYKEINSILIKLFKNNNEPIQLTAAIFQDSILRTDEIKLLLKCNLALTIPITINDNLAGTINFGRKISGKAFSDEDIDLLKAFAIQTSVVLENSKLRQVEVNKKKFDEELSIARKIQMDLLPKNDLKTPELHISGLSIPSEVIGGDFFDIINIDENKVIAVVADVSGKGIPAAIYMSKIQAMIQFASSYLSDPKEILIEVNKKIFDRLEKKNFVTVVLVALDLINKKVHICRAGHNPPLKMHSGIINTIFPKGLGLGLERGKLFETNLEQIVDDFEENNIYFIYTDGLTECMNEKKEEYGTERLLNFFNINNHSDIMKLKSDLLTDFSNFRGNALQNDDITFLFIKINKLTK